MAEAYEEEQAPPLPVKLQLEAPAYTCQCADQPAPGYECQCKPAEVNVDYANQAKPACKKRCRVKCMIVVGLCVLLIGCVAFKIGRHKGLHKGYRYGYHDGKRHRCGVQGEIDEQHGAKRCEYNYRDHTERQDNCRHYDSNHGSWTERRTMSEKERQNGWDWLTEDHPEFGAFFINLGKEGMNIIDTFVPSANERQCLIMEISREVAEKSAMIDRIAETVGSAAGILEGFVQVDKVKIQEYVTKELDHMTQEMYREKLGDMCGNQTISIIEAVGDARIEDLTDAELDGVECDEMIQVLETAVDERSEAIQRWREETLNFEDNQYVFEAMSAGEGAALEKRMELMEGITQTLERFCIHKARTQ